MKLDADDNQTPLHIHLNEDVSPDWLNKSTVKESAQALERLGFSAGKHYFIYEMDGYKLQAFYKAPVIAVLYWHDVAGCWVDLAVEEVDGIEYTESNAPMGGEMGLRPDTRKSFKKNATITELNESINRIIEASNKAFVEIDSTNFREYFEAAFKKDIYWKNRNGGISYDEFVAIEKGTSFNSSKKTIEEAFIELKEQELFQWHEAALEEYRLTEGIDDETFYEKECQMLAVPYTTSATAFINYLTQQCFINENQQAHLINMYAKETDMLKLFDKLNELLSPELRASFIKDVDYPLPIKLFRISRKMFQQ